MQTFLQSLRDQRTGVKELCIIHPNQLPFFKPATVQRRQLCPRMFPRLWGSNSSQKEPHKPNSHNEKKKAVKLVLLGPFSKNCQEYGSHALQMASSMEQGGRCALKKGKFSTSSRRLTPARQIWHKDTKKSFFKEIVFEETENLRNRKND